MLQRVQVGKGSLVRDVILQTVEWVKGVVRESRDVKDSAKEKGFGEERRDVTDSASGKGVGRERRHVTDSAMGKWSLGRDVMLQTVQV